MLAMSYDAALRREEICSLETTDIDPAHRMLRIRAEKTKNRTERIVPYSPATSELFSRYLTNPTIVTEFIMWNRAGSPARRIVGFGPRGGRTQHGGGTNGPGVFDL